MNQNAIPLALESDILAAQNGDRDAFARLVEKTRNTISSIALAIVKDLDGSEDVAQQVYIAVWQGIKRLKNTASFLPWVRQTTRYKAYNYLRDNRVSQRLTGEQAESVLSRFCSDSDTQELAFHRGEQSMILSRFIDQLPDDSREIVLLYYREEQSTQQVAELLEISEAVVRQRLSRVRKQLQSKLLQKYGRLILSTAPTVSFSMLMASAMVGTSPVAASTLASTFAGSKTTLGGKLLALLGGAFIGIVAGLFGAWYGAKRQIEQVDNLQAKARMKLYRNQLMVWVALAGTLFSLSFPFSPGWVLPLVSYVVFLLGLLGLVWRNNLFYDQVKYANRRLTQQEKRRRRWDYACGIWGTLLGVLLGLGGLIVGFIASGRMPGISQ